MKAKRMQIRQWLLFVVLVTIALYLHLRFPIESVGTPADEQSLEAGEPLSDASAGASAPLATMPSAPLRRDEHRAHDGHDASRTDATNTSLDTPPFDAMPADAGVLARREDRMNHVIPRLGPHNQIRI
jgi:hypothetical protein